MDTAAGVNAALKQLEPSFPRGIKTVVPFDTTSFVAVAITGVIITLLEATMSAVRDRLRPILMTSLAFRLGVLPLAHSTGAGPGAQRAIGMGVLGGMIVGTLLGLFFVPLFFVVIQRLFGTRAKARV